MSLNKSCVVSLIGRPNVGKSTIFNRLLKNAHKAMTYNQPGVTRDRHYAIASLEDPEVKLPNKDIILVDTGGFYPEKIEEEKILGKRKTAEPFFNIMAEQAKMAIEESDLILFVVDVREGLIPFDETIAKYLRATKRPVWVLVNKFDTDKQWGSEAEFYKMGIDNSDFLLTSAEHGLGLGELRERLYHFANHFDKQGHLLAKGVTPNFEVVAKVSILGAPNAGKSTLLNHLVGSERALVSDVAGTTVDPIEGHMDLNFGNNVEALRPLSDPFRLSEERLLKEFAEVHENNQAEELIAYDDLDLAGDWEFAEQAEESLIDVEEHEKALESDDQNESSLQLEETQAREDEEQAPVNTWRTVKIVDTAGIRKQKLVRGHIEEVSVYRSLRAISESDIVIYMVDALKGVTHQDRRLMDIALEKGKSILICLNKIDLMPEVMNDKRRKRDWLLDLQATIPWLSFCELSTISAKKGTHIRGLKKSLVKTILLRSRPVATGALNRSLSEMVDRHPVVLNKKYGTRFKLKYASMVKTSPPTILLFTNKSKGIPENFRKYLVNGIRREFKYYNTPVHLLFRTSGDLEKRMHKAK